MATMYTIERSEDERKDKKQEGEYNTAVMKGAAWREEDQHRHSLVTFPASQVSVPPRLFRCRSSSLLYAAPTPDQTKLRPSHTPSHASTC